MIISEPTKFSAQKLGTNNNDKALTAILLKLHHISQWLMILGAEEYWFEYLSRSTRSGSIHTDCCVIVYAQNSSRFILTNLHLHGMETVAL